VSDDDRRYTDLGRDLGVQYEAVRAGIELRNPQPKKLQ